MLFLNIFTSYHAAIWKLHCHQENWCTLCYKISTFNLFLWPSRPALPRTRCLSVSTRSCLTGLSLRSTSPSIVKPSHIASLVYLTYTGESTSPSIVIPSPIASSVYLIYTGEWNFDFGVLTATLNGEIMFGKLLPHIYVHWRFTA